MSLAYMEKEILLPYQSPISNEIEINVCSSILEGSEGGNEGTGEGELF